MVDVNQSYWRFQSIARNGDRTEAWLTLDEARKARAAHEANGCRVFVRYMREDGTLSGSEQADKDFCP